MGNKQKNVLNQIPVLKVADSAVSGKHSHCFSGAFSPWLGRHTHTHTEPTLRGHSLNGSTNKELALLEAQINPGVMGETLCYPPGAGWMAGLLLQLKTS